MSRQGTSLLVLVALLWIGPFTGAQEYEARTVITEPELIKGEELRIWLEPLTRAELTVEAQAWRDLLRQRSAAIATKQLEARQADAAARAVLTEEISNLKLRRTNVVGRLNMVLDALERKGGDAEELRQYVRAISGSLEMDVTDAGAAWVTVRTWLRSEEGGIWWGLATVKFIATLLVFWILAMLLGAITSRSLRAFRRTSELLRDFLAGMVRKTVLCVGLVVALTMLEVNIGPFLAAMGAVGFIIGFALQGTLSNFACGVMILLYRPYDIGDVVTVAGVTGTVRAMTIVSTTIGTPDNQTIVVPNASIWGGIITNITGSATRRVDLLFGIGYRDDVDRAQQILERLVAEHSLILADPEPVVRLHELGPSSVNFVVRPWVKTGDYWQVYWDLHRSVKQSFDAEGISIPFPQQDVHLYQETPAGAPDQRS